LARCVRGLGGSVLLLRNRRLLRLDVAGHLEYATPDCGSVLVRE
jgi:hypothetical protein